MKKFMLIAAVCALAACNQAEAPAEETVVVEEPAAPLVAPGNYDVANADGSTNSISLNADGTFTTTSAEGEQVSGTYEDVDGKVCFTGPNDEGEEGTMCWLNDPAGEDGSFASTSDDGEKVTVTPAAAEAAAE